MKISHKLIFGYLAIAFLMSSLGFLSIKVYNDIKHKVIQLKVNTDKELTLPDEILYAIESGQTAAHELFKKKYKIVFKPYEKRPAEKEIIQAERNLKADLEQLARLLSNPKISAQSPIRLAKARGQAEIEELRGEESLEWLNIKKKRYYYHWKYISYFLHLAGNTPNQARAFFETTLEPHYRRNILPIIDKQREFAHEEMQNQYRKFIEEDIPNAAIIIIVSTIFTLCTVSFLGFWTSRSVSRPLINLSNAALEIGKGQLGTKIDIKTKDEIGVLANAFNQMAHDLSRTTVSKSYVDNIINSMLDTLIVVNDDAKISMVNKSTLDLLGYEKKELIGKPINKIIAEESSHSSAIKQLISEGAVGNIEKTYLTKDGHNIPVLFSGAAMRTDNDELQEIVCVARDIIERKQAEVALKKAKDELELRVAERTAELLNANTHLQKEIEERRRTEVALRESKGKLRSLSSQLLKAQEKERRRISLELHDELGQSLSLLKVQLGAIKRKLDDDQSDLIIDLEEPRQHLNYIIESVRRLSRDLSPSILEDLGLSAALEWLVSDFARHHNLSLSYAAENIDDFFSHEHLIIIYRIFQETLSNIGKHAQASEVFVKIKKMAHEVSFLIADNGIGFDIRQVSREKPTEKGMGLAAMQERALIIRSSLAISAQTDKGTQISFKIPI